MNSNKITTNNPLVNPNKMRQKLVTAADYNQLVDDVKLIEDSMGAPVASSPFPITTNPNSFSAISLIVKNGVGVNLEQGPLLAGAILTADAVIASVNYTGTEPIKYNLKIQGGAFNTPDDEDPSVPYILFTLNEVPIQLLEVWATAGMDSTFVTTYVEVQNNKNIV